MGMGMRRIVLAIAMSVALLTATAEAADILVPPVNTPWLGKIFVSHDEWLLGDQGISVAPDARQLALNVAAWFTGGRPGRFLVYSSNFGLTEPMLASSMTAAGHTWTVSMQVPFTVASLQQFDAVFLAGDPVDLAVLIDYVRAGGHVFLEGGTGVGGGPEQEAANWNPFLNYFGLTFEPVYNLRAPGVYPVASPSPLFKNVTALYELYGSPISKLPDAGPNTNILIAEDGYGLFATYEGTALPVAVEVCPARLDPDNRAPVAVTIVGGPDFDVRKVDLDSVRVVEVATRRETVAPFVVASPGRRVGKTSASACRPRTDRQPDLTAVYDARDLLRAAEQLLGAPLADGDMVSLTLSGRLKAQFGSTPIVGESLITVRDHGSHGWHWGHWSHWGPWSRFFHRN